MNRLSGKIALITAAGQGIGKATAERFKKEGATVISTDLNAATGVEQLDVTSAVAIDSLIDRHDEIDILFNCAGFVHTGSIMECTEEDWDFSFELNVKSMYRLCRAVLPKMLSKGGGSIINMSSVASSVIGAPNRFVYGASKAAVIGLTKAIAADYAKDSIRCNAICPGTVQSPSLEDRLASTGDYATAREQFIARQPLGRIGEPEEIANLATYLGSDESAFTTGQIHIIDGGWSNT